MSQIFEIDPRLNKTPFWLTIGCCILATIFYFSFTSKSFVPSPGHADKLYHGFAYAVLMGWWLQLYTNRRMRLGLVLLFIAMGACIELMQSFHPMRYFDLKDMLANAIGVLIAWVLGFMGFDQILYRFERRFWPG